MVVKLRALTFLLLSLAVTPCAHAKHDRPESSFVAEWCQEQHGQAEVRLLDGTRCDCLTDTHAIEFDFAPKWYEAVGQALYYGFQTGKKPGIVLILEGREDYRYWLRLNSTLEHYRVPIRTWKLEMNKSPVP
jgi:hypothetical protein